jgi:CelD/BcsL family acetyltransferase involved in cellulose biosynthesis
MSYTVTLTHDPAELFTLKEAWETLQQQSGTTTIFMTWEWVTTWWSVFGERGKLWLIQARDENQRLVGLAPLIRVKRGNAVWYWHQLEFIGTSTACDHLDFIVEKGCESAIIPLFLKTIKAHRSQWGLLRLASLPPASPNLEFLEAARIGWQKQDIFTCPVVTIPEDWDTFFMALSKGKRKEQRRYRRQLEEAFGDRWKWELVDDPSEMDDVLDEMIRLHQIKWEELGEAGGFADSKVVELHHKFAQRGLERGWLCLYRLKIEEETAAILYSYQYQKRAYDFASGFDYKFSDYSPGQMLTEIAIHQAMDNDVKEYDFLRGNEPYKFRWVAEPYEDCELVWVASLRIRVFKSAVEGLRVVWRQVKHFLPDDLRQNLRRRFKSMGE